MLKRRLGNSYGVNLILVLFLALMSGFPDPLYAQQSTQATIWITKVDTSEFPTVRVYVSGNGLNADLATLPATLRENGNERTLISNETETVGVQVALLLDSARSIAGAGSTGDPQYIEAGLAARRLVSESPQKQWLSPDTDWLTAVAYTTGAQTKVLREWTRDHQAVADSLYTFNPVEENLAERTGLFDLLFFSARSFSDTSPAETQGKNRAIVIFSDGFDSVSTTQLGDLALASTQPIPVHTVMVGRDVAAQRQNLERLALLTGGTFVRLATGLQDVDPVWEAIAKTRGQQVLTYRSQEAQLREVSVALRLPDGRTVETSESVPSVGVQKAQVQIQEPAEGQEIVRQAQAYDTPLENLTPAEIPVQLAIDWPNYPREITKVEYDVAGAGIVERSEPPFDEPFAFPIGQLDSGRYSLRVRVTDELGLVTESSATTFSIVVRRPPNAAATAEAQAAATATAQALVAARATSDARVAASEATSIAAAQAAQQGNQEVKATAEAISLTAEADRVAAQSTSQALNVAQVAAANAAATANTAATASALEAKATATVLQGQLATTTERVQTLSWVSIVSSALAVVALALAIYVLSNRDRRRRATEIVTGTVKAVTQPFVRSRRGKPLAQLILVDSAGVPGIQAMIPLREHGTVKIGRDPELVGVALNDQRVSRLHCRITDDASGGFRVWDEGSASGTYVNDEDVPMQGTLLKPGDLLAIGPIEYRFEVDAQQGDVKSGTEPMRRTQQR